MKRLALTCLVLAASATASLAEPVPKAMAGDIRNAAGRALKDPYSARFERMQLATRPNVKGIPTQVVCGFVNAKNSFGAYVGGRPFIYFVKDKTFFTARPGDSADAVIMPAMLRTFCTGLI